MAELNDAIKAKQQSSHSRDSVQLLVGIESTIVRLHNKLEAVDELDSKQQIVRSSMALMKENQAIIIQGVDQFTSLLKEKDERISDMMESMEEMRISEALSQADDPQAELLLLKDEEIEMMQKVTTTLLPMT